MNTIFLFDIKSYFKRRAFILILLLIIVIGFLGGMNAQFSISDTIFRNSPYQISFILSLVSLTTIFFSTLFTSQLLFKEVDSNFEFLLFSTPLKKKTFVLGRYVVILLLSYLFVLLLSISFLFGQYYGETSNNVTVFSLIHVIYPLFIFGFINTFFTTAILSYIGWISKNKLFVYITGLLLYVIYIILQLYSNSLLVSQLMPQSDEAKFISALIDPFGLSAFFHQTVNWSVLQRNTEMVSLTGVFLINRLGVFLISVFLLFLSVKKFSLDKVSKPKRIKVKSTLKASKKGLLYGPIKTVYNLKTKLQSLISFTKIDLIYIVKSIPFVLIILILLFVLGMEIPAEIDKGSRIPEHYATSGLMLQIINQNFHVICVIVVLFYSHDIFWRSTTANFNALENTTANSEIRFLSKWLTLSIIVVLFSVLMLAEGILFQLLYEYYLIEWSVYKDVFIFNTLPLILLSGILLLIQEVIHKKHIGLIATSLFALAMATPISEILIEFPLLKFLNTIQLNYSDMNGFGFYKNAFVLRLAFGFSAVLILITLLHFFKKQLVKKHVTIILLLLSVFAFYSGSELINGSIIKNEDSELQVRADYEKQFRAYENLAVPIITDVKTTVNLYPTKNRYTIQGQYILENKTQKSIHKVVVNFPDDFNIKKATLLIGDTSIDVKNTTEVIVLKKGLKPNEKAIFNFKTSYQWKAVNGHEPFNAIIGNGSFMRISRYYPQFGYQKIHEIHKKSIRKQFNLKGNATKKIDFNSPKSINNSFINLDMTISTSSNQIAVGVGELVKSWKENNQNYFHYKTTTLIPFHFAIASAKYAVKKDIYNGKKYEIYYHPSHHENVEHLLKNAKLTMDYCETNFGKYPFETIRFVEISNFTKGFAATAYPGTIYAVEDKMFHSNIKADKQQDVINELAGHELAHIWWGTSQIFIDERVGGAMLIETLAMYVEIMLLEKMYGKEKVWDRLKMHLTIYNNSRGFKTEEPLYKVKNNSPYISYSKGAITMYNLKELIGEDTVNKALKMFLEKNKYPNLKPISSDFLNELYTVTDEKFHSEIKKMFTEVNDLKIDFGD
ncbi:ABC transporter permease/M1 family aminopeptidase [Flavivirga rizhaonensis]|uniref:Aminopeptidase n=1 Tax=Flavivirga rizhaonensis TaxID=2559571 RepID=A0A4S1E264_9FLAO|nr:M1 family aminopeptidase [Flavivirga rizhaonensis]TGV04716.1 aminopeptidase [Flavivirga rizhaonensis]